MLSNTGLPQYRPCLALRHYGWRSTVARRVDITELKLLGTISTRPAIAAQMGSAVYYYADNNVCQVLLGYKRLAH